MRPDARAAERFFAALSEIQPPADLTHLHLGHWPPEHQGAVMELVEAGFLGRLVVARVSLQRAFERILPPGRVVLDDHPSAGEPAGLLLMELPQGREAVRRAIAEALAVLPPQGRLLLFGHRELGIHTLAEQYSGATTLLTKGHMRLVSLPADASHTPAPRKRNETPPVVEADGFARLRVTLLGEQLELATLPGVFSWQELDPATKLLVETAGGQDPGERVLDWGCGNGVVGLAMARRWPNARVVMSDDLWRAVRCARRSRELCEARDRCSVVAEDGWGPGLQEEPRFHTILSNPPFHRGAETEYRATHQFLKRAGEKLHPKGALWVVGNRFLAFDAIMAGLFANVEAVAETNSFTVWRAKTPIRRRG